MHKVHISYIYTRYREEMWGAAGVTVDVVVEGDSWMKKDKSVATEKKRRRTVQ